MLTALWHLAKYLNFKGKELYFDSGFKEYSPRSTQPVMRQDAMLVEGYDRRSCISHGSKEIGVGEETRNEVDSSWETLSNLYYPSRAYFLVSTTFPLCLQVMNISKDQFTDMPITHI